MATGHHGARLRLGRTIGLGVIFGTAGALLLITFTGWPTTLGNPYDDWGPAMSMAIVAGASALVGAALGSGGLRALVGLVAGALAGALAGAFVGGFVGPGGSEAESALSLVWGLIIGCIGGATVGLAIGVRLAARHRRQASERPREGPDRRGPFDRVHDPRGA